MSMNTLSLGNLLKALLVRVILDREGVNQWFGSLGQEGAMRSRDLLVEKVLFRGRVRVLLTDKVLHRGRYSWSE